MTDKPRELTVAGGWRVGDALWDNGTPFTIERIEMRADGKGSGGHYDVIYIYGLDDVLLAAFPAHNCDYWQYRRPTPGMTAPDGD